MFCEFDKKIDDLLSKMTLKEKIGQLNQITITPYENNLEQLYEMIRNGEVGSIIIASTSTAGNDPQDVLKVDVYNHLQKIAVEESRLGIPMIYGRDVIHGHRTVYPIPLATAASFNEELTEKCFRNIAKEAAADGIHWTFSPMLDMCHDPRWGRVIECPGEDPFVGASVARAVVKGFQGDNLADNESIIACAKHYIGYGASEGGRDYHRTEISDYSLYNYYLPAFRSATEAGVGTVMSSFNDINGQPVTSSKKYLTDILRGKLGFEGFVVSDWSAISLLQNQGVANSKADCAKLSINAGLDLDMCSKCYIESLEELVKSGEVLEETIDLSVKRILKLKFAKNLFENPYRKKIKLNRTEHLKLAREAAGESMILLKNDGVLPLKKDMTIAVAGPFLRARRALLGSWTLDGRAEETPNFLEALNNAVVDGKIVCDEDDVSVYSNIDVISLRADAIVLALGESEKATGEGRSVADISLHKDQIDLIAKAKATGKKVIGVFFCGRPIAMQGVADMLDGVIYAWHCGSETANAACDILFGDVNPSGKSPITFAKKTGHIPLYYNVTSSGLSVNCYYGQNPQRCYVDGGSQPYYPFGYGLSYTSFKYSNLKSDNQSLSLSDLENGKKFKISILLENEGDFDGKEVAQLYIRDVVASTMRPLRELKAFKKVFLKRGQSETVDFELGFDDLGFYTADGEYIVEKGDFEIFVGEHCLTKNKISISVK